jgi:hypothetical protein
LDEVGGAYSTNGEKRNAFKLLVGKPEENMLLERSKCRWVNKINLGLMGIVCGGLGWIGLAQGKESWRALVKAVMNHRVP